MYIYTYMIDWGRGGGDGVEFDCCRNETSKYFVSIVVLNGFHNYECSTCVGRIWRLS